MNNLHQYLDEAARMYYAGSPTINDDTFDRLAESVSYNKVGTLADNEEEHLFPLYSLQKYYEGEDNKKPLEGYSSNDITISPKLDGACISLLYIEGKLVRALTRGDGLKGKLITDKILSRPDLVPRTILNKDSILQIVGEIVASKDIENSRNYAAGALNLKDISDFKTRAIVFISHSIYPYIHETYEEDIKTLSRWNFSTIKDKELHNIFPCDGVVFRLNNNAEFERLGCTAHSPRGSYALKTRGEAVETTLLDVVWQVSKTGRVTPVAILEPVYIGDALISRATLNNPGFIEALDLEIGCKVAVIRSGEIIPTVLYRIDG